MNDKYSRYKSIYWTIKYPSKWFVENHKGGVSFFGEDGVGALQVSAYSKDERIIAEDLNELIENEVPHSANLNDITIGNFTGVATEFEYKNHFWRMWFLTQEKILLYVTYNCECEVRDVEREMTNKIVSTLKCINHE